MQTAVHTAESIFAINTIFQWIENNNFQIGSNELYNGSSWPSNGCVKRRWPKESPLDRTLGNREVTRTSKRGSHAGTPLQYHIEQHDEAYPQQVLSCYLPAVKAVNWMNCGDLQAKGSEGRREDH